MLKLYLMYLLILLTNLNKNDIKEIKYNYKFILYYNKFWKNKIKSIKKYSIDNKKYLFKFKKIKNDTKIIKIELIIDDTIKIKYTNKKSTSLDWIFNIINSNVVAFDINNLNYLNSNLLIKYYGKKNSKIEKICKLIYPYKIYYKEDEYFNKLFNITGITNKIYIRRKYDWKIFEIDLNEELFDINKKFKKFEFPLIIYLNEITYNWILNLDLIFLIYFKSKEEVLNIKKLEKIGLKFINDVQILIDEGNSKYSNQLKNMLEISSLPGYRILELNNNYIKYKPDYKIVNYKNMKKFIKNHKNNNLIPFKSNELIKKYKNEEIKDINYKTLKSFFNTIKRYYFILVYSTKNKKFKNYLKILLKIKNYLLKKNFNFIKYFKLNHFKNDIDNHFYNELPFIIFITPKDIYYYNINLEKESLLYFVNNIFYNENKIEF